MFNKYFITPVLDYDFEAHFAYVIHLKGYLRTNINLPSVDNK